MPEPTAKIDATRHVRDLSILLTPGPRLLVRLCAMWLLNMSVATAPAGERQAPDGAALPSCRAPDVNASAVNPGALPPVESIDAQTDITVFLRPDVPKELQLAALRRAWIVDPAIRDFDGLGENDWDFENPSTIAGFGELSSDVDIAAMLAQAVGRPLRPAAQPPGRMAGGASFVTSAILHTTFVASTASDDIDR
jgi:hypothetical protein